MNKGDILKKAQDEKNDEREKQIRTKSYYISWLSVSAVTIFLIIWRMIHNESAIDLSMILMAQTSAGSLYQYFKMPEKKSLFAAGIMGIIG